VRLLAAYAAAQGDWHVHPWWFADPYAWSQHFIDRRGEPARESSMMHVVMFVTSDLLHDNRVRREAETLAEAGFQVTVFSYIASQDIPRLGWERPAAPRAVAVEKPSWLKPQQAVNGALARLRRTYALSANQTRWGGSSALADAARGVEAGIYHAHNLDTLAVASWLARRYRARLVYDAHELFPDLLDLGPEAGSIPAPKRFRQQLMRANSARLQRALIGRADVVITVSGSIADELAGRYHVSRPVLVLNCPRFQDMSAGSGYLRNRLGLHPAARIILSQGALFPGRGQVELVQSLALLPEEFQLVFLGFNLGTFQEPIRQEIARLGLSPRVHLLDALPAEQLPEATASADVGIILLADLNKNQRYAMPNKLFEYMMAGLPFIANDLPEISRVAEQTGAGLTIGRITPAAIAGGVQKVLGDPDRHQRMRTAGLSAARTEYNWAQQAKTLLGLYTPLCERRHEST
jgi:glycosyltransferase involved in cell wall biosynthesis